jgi:phosphoribosylanthranilate isomerase
MTKIKICGITRAEDALLCAELGANFLGFVFVRESPRYVEPAKAREILLDCGSASCRFQSVGVFRDASPEIVRAIAKQVGLDFVQLHGNESDDDIAAIGVPAIKAFRVDGTLQQVSTSAEWVLFDSGGGSGRTFDWKWIEGFREKKFFLAGGITPANVAAAIEQVHPDAIDVATGVERAPGIKDHDKVKALFRQVRR